MNKLGNYDIIYISFSDLRTDGRSRNFIDAFTALGQKVFTISLAGKDEPTSVLEENSIRLKLKNSRFIRKWREFASHPLFQRGQTDLSFLRMQESIGCQSEQSEESRKTTTPSRLRRATPPKEGNSTPPLEKRGLGGVPGPHPKSLSLEERDLKSIFAADLYSLPVAIKLAKNILKETGSKPQIIYDSREIFSALGPLTGQSIKQKIIAYLEKRFIRKVDKFVVSGELDEEYLKSYFKTDKPFYVVKNYPKKQEIIKSDYLREKFNIPAVKKILVYQGVLLGGRGIMPMMKSMNQLKDKYAFCIIGSGGKEEEFRKYVLDNNLQDCVYFHQEVEYSELLNITASADIGLCLIEPISFSYELALPNKLFEYIACGLPVLVSDLPALRKVVEENEVGGIIPRTLSTKEITDLLTDLEQNYEKYKSNLEQKANEFFFEGQEEEIREMID